MSLDIAPALRTAVIDATAVSSLLATYVDGPAVHTRLPVPADTETPYIVIAPDTAIGDFDALDSDRPVVIKDIAVFGAQPDEYRTVEYIGYALREIFHRERFSIILTSHDVVSITVNGPITAPVSDEETVGRLITLTIQLRAK